MYGYTQLIATVGATCVLLGQGVSAATSACASPSTTASSFPEPSADPFYKVPKNIGSYNNGQVVKVRGIASTTNFGQTVNARQVFYRTTNRQGDATGTVTTIFVPAAPVDPPKIFSYQNYEDALNLRCSPSWAIVNSSSEQEAYLSPLITALAEFSLSNGYYFITSDDEDRDSEWLVGNTEGRAVVDGVRAATENLCLSSPAVVMLGYSGGAHETVWALNQVTNGYASDVNVVGAAFGGTPIDPKLGYELLNGSPDAILAGGALLGYAKGYPKLWKTLFSLATAKGKRLLNLLETKDACLVEHSAAFAGVNFSSPTIFRGGDIESNPVLSAVSKRESLLQNVSPLKVPVPKMPRLEWHGTADTTVPYDAEKLYVQQQCNKGADIRFVSFPGQNHTEAAVSGIPGALAFLEECFAGTVTPAQPCGANVSLIALDSTQATEVLGAKVVSLLESQ